MKQAAQQGCAVDGTVLLLAQGVEQDLQMVPAVRIETAFGQALQGAVPCDMDIFDERLTTVAAERILLEADMSREKRRKVIDKMAAVVFLQGYQDARAYEKRRALPWTTKE